MSLLAKVETALKNIAAAADQEYQEIENEGKVLINLLEYEFSELRARIEKIEGKNTDEPGVKTDAATGSDTAAAAVAPVESEKAAA